MVAQKLLYQQGQPCLVNTGGAACLVVKILALMYCKIIKLGV
jgi:hypothetical protein